MRLGVMFSSGSRGNIDVRHSEGASGEIAVQPVSFSTYFSGSGSESYISQL